MHKIYCLFFIGQALLAQTVINEYSAANFTNYTDNYGDFEDWFELYNTDNSSQNLGGYYLSDKSNNLTKYKIAVKSQRESFNAAPFLVWKHFYCICFTAFLSYSIF